MFIASVIIMARELNQSGCPTNDYWVAGLSSYRELGGQRQGNLCQFEVSLVYIVSSRTTRATKRNSVSKKKILDNENMVQIDNEINLFHYKTKCARRWL